MSEAVGDVYTDGGPTNVGAFLKGSNKYLTTNDLHITTIATVRMDEVVKLGVYDYSRLREKTVKIGRKEVRRRPHEYMHL